MRVKRVEPANSIIAELERAAAELRPCIGTLRSGCQLSPFEEVAAYTLLRLCREYIEAWNRRSEYEVHDTNRH